ncbi:dihydrolipoyl dehydrogenase [bacterium]|nr:dihydrolipoyl dehydrogenase [bacterium]
MVNKFDYDVFIIGAGPGGYVAALRATKLGLKTGLAEKNRLGGVCLNEGCIPSKSLISQANIYKNCLDAKYMGITADFTSFDYSKVFKKSRLAVDRLSKGIGFLLKNNKIDVFDGKAELVGENTVLLKNGKDKKITAKNIILATGSSPREIKNFIFDEDKILSSTGTLMMDKLPTRIGILGSGAIGIEFAHIMNSFGVEVHLIELLGRILPLEDEDVSKTLHNSFTRRGIKIYLSHKAYSFEILKNKAVSLNLESNGIRKNIVVDKLLAAVGRKPNIDAIGLEKVGVETEKGFVKVGDYYTTNVKSIYAIGDIVNTAQLAHTASKEAEIAVNHIAGIKTEKFIDEKTIPSTVYCEPQVASFGRTQQYLRENKISYEKSQINYRGLGKAVAAGKTDGFVKVLYNKKSKKILGVHIIGAEATELIHELLICVSGEISTGILADTVFAHPTFSEIIIETMKNIEGAAVHI